MKLYDAPFAPNPFTVRLFIAERGGLKLDVVEVNLRNLENRHPTYRKINPFGTVPALILNNGALISDIIAICQYLDEVADAGETMVGQTPEERALTHMWTRRVDLEIAQRLVSWWRGGDDAVDFYRGNRVPESGGRAENKLIAMQGLNEIDELLTNRDYLYGNRPGLPDVLLFGFMVTMMGAISWLLPPGRREVAAWFARMKARPSFDAAQQQVSRIEA